MVALTYGDARVPSIDTATQAATKTAAPAVRAETAAPRKHWFVRFFDALIEARMKQAEREVRMYTKLLPYTVDENGNYKPGSATNETPRGGW